MASVLDQMRYDADADDIVIPAAALQPTPRPAPATELLVEIRFAAGQNYFEFNFPNTGGNVSDADRVYAAMRAARALAAFLEQMSEKA